VILALALLLQAAQAPEPAWQGLGVHGGIDIAYDPASVSGGDGRFRVRTRGITQAIGPDGIRTVTGTTEIDCRARTATALDAKGYDLQGRLMLNAIVPVAERQAEPIRPDSPNAAVLARVCWGGVEW
jgi:hypothetical protein